MEAVGLVVSPGQANGTVVLPDGKITAIPAGWALLPPGDAGLTRRVKAAGPSWAVIEFVKRKKFSKGVWAPAENIAKATADLAVERAQPAYAKKQKSAAARRERVQTAYVGTFRESVLAFLAFRPEHTPLAEKLADAVTAHATPVGSGTVARTERIPVERRAEAAVIAWMRHKTTGYDNMHIPRVAGQRREVRQKLAERSRSLLNGYRFGKPVDAATCPLQKALR